MLNQASTARATASTLRTDWKSDSKCYWNKT